MCKHSSIDHLGDILAYILEFIQLKCRGKSTVKAELLRLAEVKCLRQSQVDSFDLEVGALTKGKPIPNNSGLVKLSQICLSQTTYITDDLTLSHGQRPLLN